MMKESIREKIIRLLNRSENYIYHYLLTKDKKLIDKFLMNSKRIRNLLEKWN